MRQREEEDGSVRRGKGDVTGRSYATCSYLTKSIKTRTWNWGCKRSRRRVSQIKTRTDSLGTYNEAGEGCHDLGLDSLVLLKLYWVRYSTQEVSWGL